MSWISPAAGAGGFEVELTNYNNTFGWVPTIDGYSNPGSGHGTAEITRHDNKDFLTVTGLADGQETTVTLSTTKTGFFPGSTTITGRALDAAYNPVLGTAVPGDGSFTVPITDYQAGYNWTFGGDNRVALVDHHPGSEVLRVTGLDMGEPVTSTSPPPRPASAMAGRTATGRSLRQAFEPTFATPVTRTTNGFTVKISNYVRRRSVRVGRDCKRRRRP